MYLNSKFLWSAICSLIVALAISACNSRKPEQEQEQEIPRQLPLSEDLLRSHEYTLWNTITGDFGDGLFRGVSLNDTKEKVGITEVFELFEELPSQTGYTYDSPELETIDVYYHFNQDQRVDRVVVDIFLNGQASSDRMWQIAEWYFNDRFGASADFSDKKKSWRGQNADILIENVSKGIDYGLKISFQSGESQDLADISS